MRWHELSEQICPIARTLSVIGDRWTVLLLRELFRDVARFQDFEERLGCARHIISDRLRKLEAAGVVRRVPYQERPVRHEYRLTEKGEELYPVLVAMLDWGHRRTEPPPGINARLVDRETGEQVRPVMTDGETGDAIAPGAVKVVLKRVRDGAS